MKDLIEKSSLDILSRNVRRLRREKRLTQSELAEGIGKTVEMICQLERKAAGTKLSTLDDIARFFDLEPAQLLMERDSLHFDDFSVELTNLFLELQDETPERISAIHELVKAYRK